MKTKQGGYYAPTITSGMITMFVGIIAVCGWAAIETILWLFSFVTISLG